MVTKQYKGTQNLKPSQALNWIQEVQKKYALNDTESIQIQESIDVIRKFIDTNETHLDTLERFKIYALDKLSKKDLSKYLEEEYLSKK